MVKTTQITVFIDLKFYSIIFILLYDDDLVVIDAHRGRGDHLPLRAKKKLLVSDFWKSN